MRLFRSAWFVMLLVAGFTLPGQAAAVADVQKIPGLGTAKFATSTHSAAAQRDFIRGLLLLHVFEYPDAAKSFIAAEKIDPGFAMAYWGEAMTYNHPVWNQVDVAAGQAALKKFGPTPAARAARIADPRARAYMAAVGILYSSEGSKRQRDVQYAEAMQRLSEAYPADDEVQLFYALALLGRSEGVRDVPTYLKAAAIAKAVFQRQPDNPGAAHYWIHGMDDPQHAAGALVAARALSEIAPDAGHAEHMCSHIFMALGMWDDVVKANVNAMRVVDDQSRAAGQPVFDCGHYSIWLEYAYYQQGRTRDGERVLTECERTGTQAVAWMHAHPGHAVDTATAAQQLVERKNASLVDMRGIAVINARDWNGAAANLKVDTAGMGPLAGWNAFTTGYAAAQRGDLVPAADSLGLVRKIATASPASDSEEREYLGILVDELNGLIASKRGDLQGGIADVQRAAATYDGMAFEFGPPETFKPPQELLGELLLADHKREGAQQAFEAALKRAPKRAESLRGLARARSAIGEKRRPPGRSGKLASRRTPTIYGWRGCGDGWEQEAAGARLTECCSTVELFHSGGKP